MAQIDRILDSIYYNSKSDGFLASANVLYRIAHNRDKSVRYSHVREYLNRQKVWTLTRAQRHRFRRVRTTGVAHSSHIQIDTADLSNIARSNGGFKYILVVRVSCMPAFFDYFSTSRAFVLFLASFTPSQQRRKRPTRLCVH